MHLKATHANSFNTNFKIVQIYKLKCIIVVTKECLWICDCMRFRCASCASHRMHLRIHCSKTHDHHDITSQLNLRNQSWYLVPSCALANPHHLHYLVATDKCYVLRMRDSYCDGCEVLCKNAPVPVAQIGPQSQEHIPGNCLLHLRARQQLSHRAPLSLLAVVFFFYPAITAAKFLISK